MAETSLESSTSPTSGDAWEPEKFISIERDRTIHPLVESAAKVRHENPSPMGQLFTSFSDGTLHSGDRTATPRDLLVALNYGLELLRCGAVLLTIEGHAHLSNRAAQTILEKKDGLSLSKKMLIADRASDTRLLQQLVQEAIMTPQQGEPQGSPITLPRKRARGSLIVRVVPGPALNCWPSTQNRTALMTLYDEDTDLQIDETLLRKLYGLTRGEAALSAILLQGRKSIDEAAAELFISPHTARTHLKRIFLKTDTHRQSELVVRMFSALL